jgi:protein-disulfide isomerase
MQDLAGQQGLNTDAFKACMINPETANQIKQTIEEGQTLAITATPTTFINGRRVVGPDKSQIEQLLEFSGTQK